MCFVPSSWNLKQKVIPPFASDLNMVRGLPAGIEAVIWQPHLHALSTTSSSSFLISFWSSWPAQAPCNHKMRWCGLVKFHLKLIHVMRNKFTAYDRAPCFSTNVNRQCPRVFQRFPFSSEMCPVWKWKNKLHQLRHPPISVAFQHVSTTSVLSSFDWNQFVWWATSCWRFSRSVKSDILRDPENWHLPYLRQSTMFSKQCQQALSSSFSTFFNEFRNLTCLEVEEQAAPAAPSVSKTFVVH